VPVCSVVRLFMVLGARPHLTKQNSFEHIRATAHGSVRHRTEP
jgi:hypothetical protein